MPFYKWIIETGPTSRQKEFELNSSNDVNAIANRRMAQTIQHLSQLARIAHDVFGAIDDECMSIFERTKRLSEKLRQCQGIVDNLNAKTVSVPVSTLVGHQGPVFRSLHVDEAAPIFSTFPRPQEVVRLRQLANGPSPPAIIPSTMIADGEPKTATHIYCQPLDQSLSSKSIMTSTNKVQSSIVPIDVSGQPFSRMSSFRRSLIHVDFFIRRKKKNDKRRNTVTEGDTKEFKDVLHNIMNEKSQLKLETNSMNEKKNPNHEQNQNIKQVESTTMNKIVIEEKNNNSSDKNTCSVQNLRNSSKLDSKSEEKNKTNASKNESVILDSKNSNSSEHKRTALFTKRKTKGHIPISTVSAAMSVAVEMRQLNGKIQSEEHSSSGNWSYSSEPNSSDSENRRNSTENRSVVLEIESNNNSAISKENNINRLKDGSSIARIPSTKLSSNNKAEISSSASSESNGIVGDETSNDTSTGSEVFFLSSDESDEEISDISFEQNYGSSTSLTTASNGSLNSLLSQTGTEMASSTGTLTSIGIDRLSPPIKPSGIELERLPTPPPPPPTIITATVSNLIILDKNKMDKDNIQNKKKLQIKNHKTTNKQTKPIQKNSKTEKTDELKTIAESSKNIFTTLVRGKSRSKCQNKLKSSEKSNKMVNKPIFNMYGSDSPPNFKQSSFIQENISPIIKNEPKNSMQSFSSGSIRHKSQIHPEKKPTFENIAHNIEVHTIPERNSTFLVGSCNTEINNVEVPSKYEHKVTVTPIQRQSSNEQNDSVLACRKTLFRESEEQRVKDTNHFKRNNNINPIHLFDNNNEQFRYQKPKPQRPMTLQPQKPKAAARVLLDPEGRVVHCTNSLDRKMHHVSPSERYNHTRDIINQNGQIRNHGDEISKQIKFCNHNNSFKTPMTAHQCNNGMENRRYSAFASIGRAGYNPETLEIYPNNPSTLQQNHKEIQNPQQDMDKYYYRADGVPTQKIFSAQSLPRQRSQSQRKPPVSITPDPNISGLPSNDTLLTQHNVNLHSKQMRTFKIPESNITGNSSEHSYSSLQKLGSPIPTEVNKSPSAMSTEDLFAVIHSCKKKMNIKTDSDISLASSSRSNSPSFLRPVSKGGLAETGFLSPRNSSGLDSRDRRSWADFRPSKEICGERKSLASDRLGPTKPTSMHDFKMLLLQTRSNSQVLGPRKSAVEMLKVPEPNDRDIKIDPMTLILPPQNSSSHSVPNSPSSDFYVYNGHSTVPFKRNHRARSTLQPRYTMYPPIFEDCSEDSENNRETLPSTDKSIDAHKNPHVLQNENSICESTSHNLRHWV